jgi:cytoskeletal protein CcmA (bactofilin family)
VKEKDVSIINKGCTLSGTFDFKGYLIVAGTVEGVLHAESVITEEGSSVKADITAKHLTIAGFFEGNLAVTGVLTLLGTAHVRASIQCGNLVVEEGGILNGKIVPLAGPHPPVDDKSIS